jgi:predicted nucleotidyltransferase
MTDLVTAQTHLEQPIARLVRAFAPERIILFGSRAKGTANPDSDADLLVVADLAGNPEVHLRRAHQLVSRHFPPVDVVFCTPEDVKTCSTAASPFLHSILETGIVVYARSWSAPE